MDSLWLAFGWVLLLEGLLPCVAPQLWRRGFTALLELRDGQIRFFGLLATLGGLFLLWLTA